MIKRLSALLIALFILVRVFSQPGPAERYLSYEIETFAAGESAHWLTVFVIPSKVTYDWSSPRSLLNSFFKNYAKNLLKKERYLLGHAFIELETPIGSDDILTGMRAVTRDEQQHLVLNEHYGLSILGADLKGRLEKAENLKEKVEFYSKKGALAFITFLINEEAAQRMHDFFEVYSSGDDTLTSPRFHYGGAFWPRYHGEGAGCSAFALAFMDLGGILRDEYGEWKAEVNIPKDLMGGPYNEGHSVKLKEIRQRHQWADSTEAHEPFEIYDPTFMYDWIHHHWTDPDISGLPAKPVMINDARGILIDARQVPAPTDEDIFIEREKPSIFVEEFFQERERE